MNNIVTQNEEKGNKNNKRYLPHDLNTKYHAVTAYLNNDDIEYTCRKYHISRYSLWRWLKKYDGTRESLKDTWIVNTFLNNFYKDTFLYSTGVK